MFAARHKTPYLTRWAAVKAEATVDVILAHRRACWQRAERQDAREESAASGLSAGAEAAHMDKKKFDVKDVIEAG